MAGPEPEKITFPPRFPTLLDINGYESTITSMKAGTNQDGEDAYEMILNPHPILIKKENIKVGERDNQGLWHISIPCDELIELNSDPMWPTWLYLKTMKGVETVASKKLKGTYQQKEIMELKKRIMAAESKVGIWRERVYLAETNIPKYMKRNFTPFLEEISPIINKAIEKTKKDN